MMVLVAHCYFPIKSCALSLCYCFISLLLEHKPNQIKPEFWEMLMVGQFIGQILRFAKSREGN